MTSKNSVGSAGGDNSYSLRHGIWGFHALAQTGLVVMNAFNYAATGNKIVAVGMGLSGLAAVLSTGLALEPTIKDFFTEKPPEPPKFGR